MLREVAIKGIIVKYDDIDFEVKYDISVGNYLHYIGDCSRPIKNPEGNVLAFKMFEGFKGKHLDLSTFNTDGIINMKGMLKGSCNLAVLDLTGFNTSSVKTMQQMFDGCSSLKHLDVSMFDTSNVLDMSYMFDGCHKLLCLNLSNFDTSNVKTMSFMFNDCRNLVDLNISSFNTSRVEMFFRMFSGCESLKTIDVSSFDTSSAIDIAYMFCGCARVKLLDLSNFNTRNVIRMEGMFSGCQELVSLDLRSFDTRLVKSMNDMFACCVYLRELDLSSFDISNVTDVLYMFQSDLLLKTVYVSNDMYTRFITINQSLKGVLKLKNNNNLRDRVSQSLIEGNSEKEIVKSLIKEGFSEAVILGVLCEVSPKSNLVLSFVDSKIVPYTEELLLQAGKKVTIGEARKILCKEYPDVLVNKAMWVVMSNRYLID